MHCVLEIAHGNNMVAFRLQVDGERFAYIKFIINDEDIQRVSSYDLRRHKVLVTFTRFHKSLRTQSLK
jgi:hypothetical protein